MCTSSHMSMFALDTDGTPMCYGPEHASTLNLFSRRCWGCSRNVAWQRLPYDNAPSTLSSTPLQYFQSKFSASIPPPLQHKVNLYVMAQSCLTPAELHAGARCCEVPKLVNGDVQCEAAALFVLLLVSTANELYMILSALKVEVVLKH